MCIFTFQVWWEGGKNRFCVSDAGKSPTLFPADPPTFTSNKFYCLPNRTVTAAWTTSPVQKVGASEIHEVSVLNSSLRTCDIHNILCAYDLYIYILWVYIYMCVYNIRWRSVAVTTKLLWFPCGQISFRRNVLLLGKAHVVNDLQ